MATVTLDEAQAQLPKLLAQLQLGEELTITTQGQPLAQIKKVQRTSWPCQAGCYRKNDFFMPPDFDAPLEDFKECME